MNIRVTWNTHLSEHGHKSNSLVSTCTEVIPSDNHNQLRFSQFP